MFFKKRKPQWKKKMHTEEKMGKTQSCQKAHIHNLIIVDESGSMRHLKDVTLSGINETINTIKSAQKEYHETQTHTLTLVTFDSGNRVNIRYHFINTPIENVSEFSDYCPNGCTPLYDAMGISISELHNKIKDDEYATAVVTVLTDGMENSSQEWNAESLRKLISQLKEKGWSFSYMGSAHDVKDVADLLSINNFVEFSHNDKGTCRSWDREMSSRSAYFAKMHNMIHADCFGPLDARVEKMKEFANEYYSDRVTPENITSLNPNEIFVFGSNIEGKHNGGAAATALNFGAIMGQGEGIQGNSYAIPTTGTQKQLIDAISRFINFAAKHPELRFLVTRIGCGNAGHSPNQIAQYFIPCTKLENVSLPRDFWDILGLKM